MEQQLVLELQSVLEKELVLAELVLQVMAAALPQVVALVSEQAVKQVSVVVDSVLPQVLVEVVALVEPLV